MVKQQSEIKGRIDDKFILVRLDEASKTFREINWWYTGDKEGKYKVVAIWLGFKTISGGQSEAPKRITFVDFRKPKVIPATNLAILFPRQEITAQLPYECYGTAGTGWSNEIFPGRVLHLADGETTFGDIGFKLYEALKKLAPKVNGSQAIVVLEDIVLEGSLTSYHRPFDDTPKAKLSFTVYKQ